MSGITHCQNRSNTFKTYIYNYIYIYNIIKYHCGMNIRNYQLFPGSRQVAGFWPKILSPLPQLNLHMTESSWTVKTPHLCACRPDYSCFTPCFLLEFQMSPSLVCHCFSKRSQCTHIYTHLLPANWYWKLSSTMNILEVVQQFSGKTQWSKVVGGFCFANMLNMF